MILPGVQAEAVLDDEPKYVKPQLSATMKIRYFLTSNTFRKWIWAIFRTALLVGLAFVILFPLFSKVINSIKPAKEMFDGTVRYIPKAPTLDNYKQVISELNYLSVLGTTVAKCAYLALMQALACTLAAYGFARFKFPGRSILFASVILTVIIPPSALLFPLYVRFLNFGWASLLWVSPDSVKHGGLNLYEAAPNLPLILISITGVAFKNGLFIYILRQYFKNVPKELEEAAFIDGAGTLRTFFRVMLPGAMPLIVTVFLFGFVWMYNDDFYWSMLEPLTRVMGIEVQSVAGRIVNRISSTGAGGQSTYSQTMQMVYQQAAVVLHVTPLALLYIITQKFFVQSIERSGLVG